MAWTIEHLDACASTMDEAKARARAGAPHGHVVVAKVMTGGRGQQGHSWHAPEGGWYASIVLRGLEDPGLLTLALGNAVADVLEVAGVEPRLKWVNDVFVGDRKIAGILVEAESTGDRIDHLVAGIGINLNGRTDGWPDGLDALATTLEQELGCDTCIEDTEPYILDSIQAWVDKVQDGLHRDVLDAFRVRDALRGRRVRVDGIEGTAQGIDDAGHLLVDGRSLANGPVTVFS